MGFVISRDRADDVARVAIAPSAVDHRAAAGLLTLGEAEVGSSSFPRSRIAVAQLRVSMLLRTRLPSTSPSHQIGQVHLVYLRSLWGQLFRWRRQRVSIWDSVPRGVRNLNCRGYQYEGAFSPIELRGCGNENGSTSSHEARTAT
jgi:hypothetical protein